MQVNSGTYVRDCSDTETLRALCGTTRTARDCALQSAVKTESVTLTPAICKLALCCEWVCTSLLNLLFLKMKVAVTEARSMARTNADLDFRCLCTQNSPLK